MTQKDLSDREPWQNLTFLSPPMRDLNNECLGTCGQEILCEVDLYCSQHYLVYEGPTEGEATACPFNQLTSIFWWLSTRKPVTSQQKTVSLNLYLIGRVNLIQVFTWTKCNTINVWRWHESDRTNRIIQRQNVLAFWGFSFIKFKNSKF